MRRCLTIFVYPFRFIYLLAVLPFKILYIIITGQEKNPVNQKKNTAKTDIDLLRAGKLLYAAKATEFEMYYHNLRNTGNMKLQNTHERTVKGCNQKKLIPVETLFSFGKKNELLCLIDWRGEENETEIELFFEMQLKRHIIWNHSLITRSALNKGSQEDGKFIIELFKSINKDLEAISQKIIFLDMNSDTYVFKSVSKDDFNWLTKDIPTCFYGVENL